MRAVFDNLAVLTDVAGRNWEAITDIGKNAADLTYFMGSLFKSFVYIFDGLGEAGPGMDDLLSNVVPPLMSITDDMKPVINFGLAQLDELTAMIKQLPGLPPPQKSVSSRTGGIRVNVRAPRVAARIPGGSAVLCAAMNQAKKGSCDPRAPERAPWSISGARDAGHPGRSTMKRFRSSALKLGLSLATIVVAPHRGHRGHSQNPANFLPRLTSSSDYSKTLYVGFHFRGQPSAGRAGAVAGTPIGAVESIGLQPDAARLKLNIDPRVELREGTTAELRQLTMLGDIYVALTPPAAGSGGPPLGDGAVIGLDHSGPRTPGRGHPDQSADFMSGDPSCGRRTRCGN